jgi:oligosaccharide repeat unit polymerase
MILILLLSVLLTYNYYYNLRLKVAMIVLPVFIVLFLFIGLYRSGRSDFKIYERNMRNSAGIYKYHVTILESFLTIYSSIRYTRMEKMLKEKELQNYWGYGSYTFRPIVKMTPLKKINYFNNPKFDTLKSLCTYSIEPYFDFGYIGVIVINLLYGLYSTHVYLNYKNKSSPQYIITFTLVSFCMIMMTFTNLFNTFFIWLMYGINKLLTN